MNETTILSDLSEYERKFAEAIINFVESQHKVHERQRQDLGASPVP